MIREMVTLLIERRDFFLGFLGEHLGISLTAILIAVLLGGLVGVLISEFDRSAKPTLAVINFSYVPSLLNGRDRARTRAAVSKWMEIVGLAEDLKGRYPAELSGGQQQRVGIARALAASPEILLMDEPFGAVDEITRGQLQEELLRIYRETGITVLFVTHDIGEALKLGTKVLVMDQGEIQQYAPPAELLRRPATPFVERLVEKERRTCRLPEERLGDCEFSGAAGR